MKSLIVLVATAFSLSAHSQPVDPAALEKLMKCEFTFIVESKGNTPEARSSLLDALDHIGSNIFASIGSYNRGIDLSSQSYETLSRYFTFSYDRAYFKIVYKASKYSQSVEMLRYIESRSLEQVLTGILSDKNITVECNKGGGERGAVTGSN